MSVITKWQPKTVPSNTTAHPFWSTSRERALCARETSVSAQTSPHIMFGYIIYVARMVWIIWKTKQQQVGIAVMRPPRGAIQSSTPIP